MCSPEIKRGIKYKRGGFTLNECSGSSNSNALPSTSTAQLQSKTHYDKEYFDSSDEEESTRDRKKLSNDELLYNPDADDDDEKWMAKQARKHEKAKTSDAVLNCPACMTVICVDCQRHTTYQHQYRAMFTMNCTVDSENVLKYKKKTTQKRGRKKKSEKEKARRRSRSKSLNRASDATDSEAEDLYHPGKLVLRLDENNFKLNAMCVTPKSASLITTKSFIFSMLLRHINISYCFTNG